jgi:MarR family 2-MHQ and catechol resistance regulon transcriptional repressor
MKENELDRIAENILSVVPLFRRSFRNIDFDRVAEGISHSHIMVMKMLEEHERLSVSAIGDKQFISRPQMTHIVDRLVSLGMAERIVNEDDRRVINVVLTDKGRKIVRQCDEIIKQSIKQSLFVLDDKDIEELSVTLSKLAAIGSKLK